MSQEAIFWYKHIQRFHNNIKWVCLTCATLHMLKQLIVVTFSWKTTIIYSKALYLILNV